MVCNRCIKVVEEELLNLGHSIKFIELGKVQFEHNLDENQIQEISEVLHINGFELISDKKSRIVLKIKTSIIDIVHHQKEYNKSINLSSFLSKTIGYDYSYLSNLFSSVEGTTIEKYLINQKIEKVKEYLVYDEQNLNEIAFRMGYSSTQHLSNQFKKVTGLSPTYFKKVGVHKRKPLDKI